jgi:hypothetical protein
MTKFSTLLAGASVIAVAGLSIGSASATPIYPAAGLDTGPGYIINIAPGGVFSITATGQGPYDGSDDTYVGIENNSGATVNSIHLSSTQDIFGFEGDGINSYFAPPIPNNASDKTGYGGPASFFTITDAFNGNVNFIGGLASGSFTYFSLEERLNPQAIVITPTTPVPEPITLSLFGAGLAGAFAMRRKAKKA